MKFLYKIHSGYDGFTPRKIASRLENNLLPLGWNRYLDVVEVGDEIWIYFHGPHNFANGVYIKGIAKSINREARSVLLRIRESCSHTPLTDAITSARVAQVVSPRYRQVFLYPEAWETQPECQIQLSGAASCKSRACANCSTWKGLLRIKECRTPQRMNSGFNIYAPAFWVIPTRCYVKNPKAEVRRTSEIFYRFKTGEEALAFPLALGVFEVLKHKDRSLNYDCIVPIPLSPDKVQAKEIHRTRLLAHELSRLIGISVVDLLALSKPISKHRGVWSSCKNFEDNYIQTLTLSENVGDYARILLIDDVCTRGSTLECAKRKIIAGHPRPKLLSISACAAGQMIITGMLTNDDDVREP